MIALFRNFTQTWTFKVILGLLVLGLGLFGFKDVFNPVLNDEVVKAGSKTISSGDYRQAFDNYKQSLEQQNGGQPISTEDAVKANLHTQLLNQMAQEAAFQAWLDQSGLKPAPKVVSDQLKKYPRFFNQVTGQFDKNAYLQALNQAKITETSFEGQLRDSIATQQFGAAAVGGIKAPKIMAALQAVNEMQSRDVSYFILDSKRLPAPAEPTDGELTTFYNSVKARLTRPEMRQFTIISFAPADYAATIPVDEAELKKIYEFRKDTLSKPEMRNFIQITAPDAASAAKISAGLKAGQDAQGLAKANKGTVINFDNKPLTAVPDRKVGNIAFALPAGEVSSAIQGDLGFAVVKVASITPGTQAPYDSVRPQLLEDYKKQKATDKVYKLVDDFEKERNAGTSLIQAAQKLGARITPLPPMTVEGRSIDGQNFAQFEKVIKTAFAQAQGGESDIEDTGNGEYYAIRVDQVLPPLTPAIKDIRPQLTQGYKAEKAAEALQTATTRVVTRLNKGESPAAVAASVGASVTSVADVEYQSAGTKLKISDNPQVGQALAGRVFTVKPKESFSLRYAQDLTVIGVVNKVSPPPPLKAIASMPTATLMGARSLGNDLFLQSVAGASATIKPKTYPKTAAKALGVTLPEVDGKAAKKDIANP
jgi:peptidyl-prolyl cis-trans isomerase D